MAVRVTPITDADVEAVSEFLHRELNERVPAHAWTQAIRVPWLTSGSETTPNHGYMLVDDGGHVLGAYLGFYSEREIEIGRASCRERVSSPV